MPLDVGALFAVAVSWWSVVGVFGCGIVIFNALSILLAEYFFESLIVVDLL